MLFSNTPLGLERRKKTALPDRGSFCSIKAVRWVTCKLDQSPQHSPTSLPVPFLSAHPTSSCRRITHEFMRVQLELTQAQASNRCCAQFQLPMHHMCMWWTTQARHDCSHCLHALTGISLCNVHLAPAWAWPSLILSLGTCTNHWHALHVHKQHVLPAQHKRSSQAVPRWTTARRRALFQAAEL